MNFKPDESTVSIDVPFFEDARADIAPGYTTRLTSARLQSEIGGLLYRLGATGIYFQSGSFDFMRPDQPRTVYPRAGYVIGFSVMGHPHMMQVAALPLRSPTDVKKAQSLRHALFVVREQLKAIVSASVFSPGSAPLVPFMLVPGTQQTVGEFILSEARLPNMNPRLTQGKAEG